MQLQNYEAELKHYREMQYMYKFLFLFPELSREPNREKVYKHA